MIQGCNCDFAESVRYGTDCVVVACTQMNNLGKCVQKEMKKEEEEEEEEEEKRKKRKKRELISARKTSHNYNNKDLSRLR